MDGRDVMKCFFRGILAGFGRLSRDNGGIAGIPTNGVHFIRRTFRGQFSVRCLHFRFFCADFRIETVQKSPLYGFLEIPSPCSPISLFELQDPFPKRSRSAMRSQFVYWPDIPLQSQGIKIPNSQEQTLEPSFGFVLADT